MPSISLDEPRSPIPTVMTKLQVPPSPRQLVARPRLFDSLDEGVRDSLVLLSAPVGSGKTVLLSSWIEARVLPGPVCWLSLDDGENTPSRLMASLLSALRSCGPVAGGDALERLCAPAGAHTERFLALLVNALAELEGPLVLVLDDVHELRSPQAAAAVDFLVRHAPSQLRVVLAGRADPPLSIGRLRLGGWLTELRSVDLAFNRDEVEQLCRALDIELDGHDLEQLWQRTEGWAAALRLAACSLHNHPDPARFLREFAGTDRAVADYLVAEVLAGVSAEQRELLLRTCLVDEIEPELADELTNRRGATLTLARIERLGAPVQSIGDGSWYRYHPLFAELLRAHLRHAHAEEIPDLHRCAAHWYGERGQTLPAIRHALAGEDWQRAGELIASHWLELLLGDGAAALREPLARLSAAAVAADPRLATALACSYLQAGELGAASHQLTIAEHARGRAGDTVAGDARRDNDGGCGNDADPSADATLELVATTIALRCARLTGRLTEAERLAGRLTEIARAGAHRRWASLRCYALCELGATRLWSDDSTGARAELEEALALAEEEEREQIVLDCLAQLALVHLRDEQLRRAAELSARAVELAERHGWCEGVGPACAYLAAAAGAYRLGEPGRAEGLLTCGASAAATAPAPVRLASGMLHALVLAAGGPRCARRASLKLLAIRAELADCDPAPHFVRVALDEVEPRVLAAAGDFERATSTLAAARAREPCRPELLVLQASLDLRAGEPERAREALTQALADRGQSCPTAARVEGWLLRALAERAAGDELGAMQALDCALAAAEQEPFHDAFVLGGPQVRELLERHAQLGTAHPALLEVLLDAIGGDGATAPADATLAEPLTEREQRILRYLPTMLSNAEIGAEVFVSLNTVKTHLRSIYRKLEVSARADAVERARQLGLLPAGIRRPRVVHRV